MACKIFGSNPYTPYRILMFILTYYCYVLISAMRKTFSNVKSSIVNMWTFENHNDTTVVHDQQTWNTYHLFDNRHDAEAFLGVLDAVFMFSYAMGLYLSGIVGERFEPRKMLVIGMSSTAIINLLFGWLTEYLHFYNIPYYVALMFINGLCQSMCWPAVVSIMGNWFDRNNRGLVLGFWASTGPCGNVIGAYICSLVLPDGYEYCFLINASLLFAGAVLAYFTIISKPEDIGLSDLRNDDKGDKTAEKADTDKKKAIGCYQAILLPGVIPYALANTFLKAVTYSILFWIPYYMTEKFKWSEVTASEISIFFDIGGILGGAIAGFISDLLGRRAPVLMGQMVFSVVSLVVYNLSPNNKAINAVLILIVGLFTSGASNLISSAITADLGRQEAIINTNALSTVSGILDGSGSFGAAVAQLIVPELERYFGWDSVFYSFIAMIAAAVVLMAKLCYQEIKLIHQERQSRRIHSTKDTAEEVAVQKF